MKIFALSVLFLAGSAIGFSFIDPCSEQPYPGTHELLCSRGGLIYWTYDSDKNDCIAYKGYCPHGGNAFENIDECESMCKTKNLDPCKDVSYSGWDNSIGGSVFWTYDQDKKGCFGYKASNPKSQNVFSSFNACDKICKKAKWLFEDHSLNLN